MTSMAVPMRQRAFEQQTNNDNATNHDNADELADGPRAAALRSCAALVASSGLRRFCARTRAKKWVFAITIVFMLQMARGEKHTGRKVNGHGDWALTKSDPPAPRARLRKFAAGGRPTRFQSRSTTTV